MQEAAQLKEHESQLRVSQQVSITTATSSAFGRLDKPLRRYKGITTDARVYIPSAQARMDEV